jgi:hypothetical protein
MTNRREVAPDPMKVGDTTEKLDHTGGAEALTNDVTPADQDYYERHIGFDETAVNERGGGQNGVPSPDRAERARPVKGSAGTVGTTRRKRGT